MKKLFKSLRFRLVVLILLVGVLPLLLMHVIVVNTYKHALIVQRENDIRQRFSVITSDLGKSERLEDALTDGTVNNLNWYSDAVNGRVLVVDDHFRILFDTFRADTGKTCISDSVFQAVSGTEISLYNEEMDCLDFAFPVYAGAEHEKRVSGALVLSSGIGWISEGLSKVEEAMQIVELILFLVLVFLAFYLSYLFTRPIKKVSSQVQKFKSGHFETANEQFRSYTEIDEIMDAVGAVIDQYRTMEENQEQFVSNVSHELRTPITSVKVLSDSLIGQENLPESVYQEFLNDISVEISRESNIIDDLLSMTRLGNAEGVLSIAPVNVNEFILGILKTLKPIALERNVELVYESFRQVNADIDEMKMNLALSNLIENGIKYNREGGSVKVSLDADHEYFYVRIEDNGIGIPEDAIPHLFDRFYRVDKDRSRETGGTGLGLPIAKQIVLLHDGVIKVESKLSDGTRFSVRVPLKHLSEGGNG